jgi:hypothetical protein
MTLSMFFIVGQLLVASIAQAECTWDFAGDIVARDGTGHGTFNYTGGQILTFGCGSNPIFTRPARDIGDPPINFSSSSSANLIGGSAAFPYPGIYGVNFSASDGNLGWAVTLVRRPSAPVITNIQCGVFPQENGVYGWLKYLKYDVSCRDPDSVGEPNNLPVACGSESAGGIGESSFEDITVHIKQEGPGVHFPNEGIIKAYARNGVPESAPPAVEYAEAAYECFNEAPHIGRLEQSGAKVRVIIVDFEDPSGTLSATLISAPEGANYIMSNGSSNFSTESGVAKGEFEFSADKPGTYRFSISMTDAQGASRTEEANVVLSADLQIYANIYQVVENPNLDGDDDIDLVAGKNSDIVAMVKSLSGYGFSGLDISQSTMEWRGQTTNPNPIDPINKGQVNFELIPELTNASVFSEDEEIIINIVSGDGKINWSKPIKVQVRKTKPINLGFIRVQLNNQAPSLAEFSQNVLHGSALIRAMYPVADADYTPIPVGTPYVSDPTRIFYLNDILSVNNMMDLYSNPLFGATHVAGVATPNYFFHQGSESETTGMAWPLTRPFFVRGGWYRTVPHELAHTFCVRYDEEFGCDDMNGAPGVGHAPVNMEKFVGYLNNNLSSVPEPIELKRGFLSNRTSLMVAGTTFSELRDRWMDKNAYETIFNRNLDFGLLPFLGDGIYIGGTFDKNGSLNSIISRMGRLNDPTSSSTGDFLLEAKDMNRNVIFSTRVNLTSGMDSDSQILLSHIPFTTKTFFVDIYRDGVRGMRQGIGTLVVPVDLIVDIIPSISGRSVNGVLEKTIEDLRGMLAEFRGYLLSGNLSFARDFLGRKLYPFVYDEFRDDFEPEFLGESGRAELITALNRSLLQLYANETGGGDPINPFIRLRQDETPGLGQRAALDIDLLRDLADKGNLLLYDIYLDGKIVEGKKLGKKIAATSPPLTAGTHIWQVVTSTIDNRIYQQLTQSMAKWMSQLGALRAKLNGKIELEERMVIEKEILILERKISDLRSLSSKEKTRVSTPISLQFEVQ